MEFAVFERFELELAQEDVQACSHAGECYNDVSHAITLPYIAKQLDEIGAEAIRQELNEYGCWDAEELADDEMNRCRIVWIAACNIREEQS
jgi:hypothetical protein